jgi:hypothetical protein
MPKSDFEIFWIDREREPENPPDPRYPDGIDIDLALGRQPTCTVKLPYPAPRCGIYSIDCKRCDQFTMVTTAGRPDDPRSVKLACKLQ